MKTWTIYGVNHTELERVGSYAIVRMAFAQPNTPEYLGLFKVSPKGKYNFISNLRISDGWSSFDDAKDALVNRAINYDISRKNQEDSKRSSRPTA
jgi:hypothetical protein